MQTKLGKPGCSTTRRIWSVTNISAGIHMNQDHNFNEANSRKLEEKISNEYFILESMIFSKSVA